MAKISTSVALYQAGESLYELFDKVLLIDEGRCAYFGRAEYAILTPPPPPFPLQKGKRKSHCYIL